MKRQSVLTAFILILLSWHDISLAAGPQGPPPAVLVTTIISREVNPPEEYVGRIEAVQSVILMARVNGFIEDIHFHEGDMVKEGKPLYTIDQRPYKAQVDADKAKVSRAEAALMKAKQYLQRMRSVKADAISASDLETAISLELEANADLQEAKAELEESMLDLGYTVVKAPFDGRIGKTAFYIGSLVGPDSEPLARIVQIDPIRVLISISENQLPEMMSRSLSNPSSKIRGEKIFRLKLPNGEIYPYAGREDFINNIVDSGTGTIAIRALFDNPDHFLVPGQYVSVIITDSKSTKVPVVPQAAVLEDSHGSYVLVVDKENRVERRAITMGPDLGTQWVVKKGLKPGESVIIEGTQKAMPGNTVTPVQADEGQKKAAGL